MGLSICHQRLRERGGKAVSERVIYLGASFLLSVVGHALLRANYMNEFSVPRVFVKLERRE